MLPVPEALAVYLLGIGTLPLHTPLIYASNSPPQSSNHSPWRRRCLNRAWILDSVSLPDGVATIPASRNPPAF